MSHCLGFPPHCPRGVDPVCMQNNRWSCGGIEGATDCGHNPCKGGYMTEYGYCQKCPHGTSPVCDENGDKWTCSKQGLSSETIGIVALVVALLIGAVILYRR